MFSIGKYLFEIHPFKGKPCGCIKY